MIFIWILSSLVLSFTFGNQIYDNTRNGSNMTSSSNVTERNSTEFTSPTNRSDTGIQNRPSKFLRRFMCRLSTCSLWNLGSVLQTGNEVAGDFAHDPMGFGKK